MTNSPSDKLRVAIIGGGIAGLAAAAFLRKYHHCNIIVYERRDADSQETSAALGLGDNGISIAKQLGIDRKEIRGVAGAGYRTYNIHEKEISKSRIGDGGEDSGMWLVYRQDLKDALLRRVTGDGDGEAIKVLYGSHVVNVDPEAGIVEFANGTSVEVDLIIGADGIHSKVRGAVIPASHPEPVPCGLSMYRFVLPMDVVMDTVATHGTIPAMYNYDDGTFIALIAAGDKGNRNVIMYPCQGHKLMNCVCAVPNSSLKNPEKLQYSWNAKGSVQELLEEIHDFPEWLKHVFSRTPQVALFQLRDQEPLPTYVKGRTVLIGDAAHAMVPYQAQGANQAFEDAEGLNVLFENASDRNSVPEILKIWDSIRRPRVSAVQTGSRASQAKIATKSAGDAILSVKPYVGMREALEQLET
ncbi:hypothetical protein N7517_001071 [Penicillium concentricum]|uniref:FAD-binding domain-containing protein n=1 Tax=Penicillium concentricum TaxID=293559 RepID=A0A9W9SS71_9EURO|nr:uncharacterized protein N7517_001071 [Penicillium concentricum]KAJ5383160.1 hypothetical protein N7517_001071 [Penicillium concentricum]